MLGRTRLEFSPLAAVPLFAAALALALLSPTGAEAATSNSPLTPELAKLATAAVAAKPATAQAEAVGLPVEGAGSLAREGERVIVEAHFEAGALARQEALQAAGAKILVASRQYQTVTISVEPEDLKALAAVPGLSAVAPARRPAVYATEGATTAATTAVTSNGLCEGGSVISQGLQQLNVPAARAAFGARGAGETVGVISDSFNSATSSIEGGAIATKAHNDEITNDLPGEASTCSGQQVPVKVLAEAPAPAAGEANPLTDEGRAMLQVVHDIAPHAQLAFANGEEGELAFARRIEELAKPVSAGGAGATVIVDDLGYFTEPFFQEGPVANAIRKVTEDGVTYLTAAGNDNIFEGVHEIASWEREEFTDTACPSGFGTIVGEGASSCLNFSPTGTDPTFGIRVAPKSTLTVDLQWAEPWHGVETDLNAYLLNAEGSKILSSEPIDNVGEEGFPEPIELVSYKNESSSSVKVQLVIDRCIHDCNPEANTTTKPRLKLELLEDGSGVTATEYTESNAAAGITMGPTIYGHAGSPYAITLGAVNYAESATAPKEPEYYSSRGPVTHYFGPVNGTTAAAELALPEEIRKPNLTATDCASTTFFAELGSDGLYHFCGTSEAGPHAAAVAALMKQTDPLASSGAIAEAMEETATGFTTVNSPDAVGAGMLNADAAMNFLGGSPVEDPPSYVIPSIEEEKAAPAPTVTITKGPKSLGNENRPTFEFTANQPATFTCQVDGGTRQACASPFLVPSVLGDGAHGFTVIATNAKGLAGSNGIYNFTIDTKAPVTKIVGHPSKVVRTRKKNIVGRFRLKASESPVTFYCQIDREPLRICASSFHSRFKPGGHTLKVKAKDQVGNLATKWTSFHFRVKALRPAGSRP